jgi:hypothetical protein
MNKNIIVSQLQKITAIYTDASIWGPKKGTLKLYDEDTLTFEDTDHHGQVYLNLAAVEAIVCAQFL